MRDLKRRSNVRTELPYMVLLIALVGCGESTPTEGGNGGGGGTGSVMVTATTTGPDQDADGYTATLGGTVDRHPAWKPDGSQLAFSTNRDGFDEIYLMSSTGSSLTRLTNNTASDQRPDWSPDGSLILFDSERDHYLGEIYTMSPNGQGVTRLTNNSSVDTYARWLGN